MILLPSLIVSPKAIALNPTEQKKLQVLLLRAKQYHAILEIEKQLVVLNEALQIDPGNIDILDLRAKAYRNINRYDKAILDYTTAIKISPKINPELTWLTIPFTMLIAWIFKTMEKVGDTSENPFERNLNDIPMSAICRNIEIDLREMLGEDNLPEPLAAVDNILM